MKHLQSQYKDVPSKGEVRLEWTMESLPDYFKIAHVKKIKVDNHLIEHAVKDSELFTIHVLNLTPDQTRVVNSIINQLESLNSRRVSVSVSTDLASLFEARRNPFNNDLVGSSAYMMVVDAESIEVMSLAGIFNKKAKMFKMAQIKLGLIVVNDFDGGVGVKIVEAF